MRTFVDRAGREWQIDLNLQNAKRIEQADFSEVLEGGKVRLLDPRKLDESFYVSVMLNSAAMAFMAWVMVYEQATDSGISQEDFCSQLHGDELMKLRETVWMEIADFFPERRTSLLRLIRAYRELQEKIDEGPAVRLIERLQQETNAELDRIMDGVGKTST